MRWPVFKGSMTIRKWERAWIFGGSYSVVKELILEIEHEQLNTSPDSGRYTLDGGGSFSNKVDTENSIGRETSRSAV